MQPDKITTRRIEELRRDAMRQGKEQYLWDTELRGFGAKAWPSGQLSWIVQKWIGGRGGMAKRITIGRCPPMSLDDARSQAGIAIGEVHKGSDLVALKQQRRKAQRESLHAVTLQDAVVTYFQRRSEPGSRFWHELRQRFDNQIVPALGHTTKVADITKAELRHLIETKEDSHPVAARTMFDALRPFFKWCVERDIIAASPMQSLNPPPVPESRDRILSDAEIKAFWKATVELSLYGPLYRLLLLTAQRRDEVGALPWSELNMKEATWIIPKERTKNSEEHLVHLSPQAMTVIQGLPKLNSPLLFTTTLTSPVNGYGKPKAKLDELMHTELGKLSPWRTHDLRRTAASGMAKLGLMPHIVERVLNHVQGGIAAVYNRYEYAEERKRALFAWGNYVEQLVSDQEKASNVVAMRG